MDRFIVALMIGIPGSGKTTFCRERLFPHHLYISLDQLRTRSAEAELFAFALRRRKNCVIDNTNINALERSRYIPAAKREGARVVGYFFEPELEECVARNAKRLGKARVPEHVIRQKLSRFERPSPDEGFDALYRVKVTERGFDVEVLDAKE
jgi:predicted kinase